MAISSTYQFRNPLHSRQPYQRPRSFSFTDYQPLIIDRDAIESAYQASLGHPSSGSNSMTASYLSNDQSSATSHGSTLPPSDQGRLSTLSHHLRPGDNPHAPPNIAGIGAGHSLTPSPGPQFNQAVTDEQPQPNGQEVRPNSQDYDAPPLPPRPGQAERFREPKKKPSWMLRGASTSDIQDMTGYDGTQVGNEWPNGQSSERQRRVLPEIPTNVPAPEVPAWEPDFKPHIPESLTDPTIHNAYAQLSAPPPNLPPRRRDHANMSAGPSTPGPSGSAGPSTSTLQSPQQQRVQGDYPPPGPSHRFNASTSTMGSFTNDTRPLAPDHQQGLPNGATEFPPSPQNMSPSSPTQPRRNRPPAEKDVFLRASDRMPIWSTHYIDPSLRNPSVKIPQQITNIANVALSGLASGPKTKYNSTIGAPVDGLAKMAKEWAVAPDGRFVSENGGIELGIGIIDGGGTEWGRDKGRQKARIEVVSKYGGVKVDVIEVDENRQIDLKVETKSGDVMIMIPRTFWGAIHVISPSGKPTFLPTLNSQLQPLSNPYGAFYTTFVVPDSFKDDPKKAKSLEHQAMSKIERYVPNRVKGQSDILDQVVAGYAHHTRGEQSKIAVTSGKGRVVIGFRETEDEEQAGRMRLMVGAQSGGRKKKWWRG